MLKNMVLIYHKIPAQKNSPVQARAGREGKGVWEKGIPAPPERKFSKISVRIFLKKSSDFVQRSEQRRTLRV